MPSGTKDQYDEAPGCTQKQLMEHFGSSLNNDVCHLMATEIDEIKTPAVQTMVDNYHQSGAKSWEQWVNNSPLNNIRQNHPETFVELENYQSQFAENIYAPLTQYESSSHNIFKGTANDLIQQIFAIYNHLKQRKIRPNCCMQIDVRWRHDMMIRACNRSYDEQLVYEQDNVADEIEYEFKGNSMPILRKTKTCNFVCDTMIDQILSKCTMPEDDNYCYKRYEVFLHGTDIKSFEAVSNNSIPQCAFENAPLCMIFNSTASVKQILHELCTETAGLITVSFHAYHGTICVYLYVSDDNAQLFGSRVFADDLISMVPLLFEYGTIITKQLNNNLQFAPNAAYKRYYLSLMQHAMNYNADDEEQKSSIDVFEAQLDPLLASKLEKTVTAWKSTGNKPYIISKVKRCFVEHGINNDYFQTHTRKDFIQLLKAYDIKTGVAVKLWRSFAHQIDETKTNVSVVTKEQHLQKQIKTYRERIQSLESELRALKQKNHDLKRVIENAICDDDSSKDDTKQSNGADVINFPSGKHGIFAVDRGFAQQIDETKTDVSVVTKEQYLQKQIEAHFERIQSLESELRAAKEENHNLKRVIENAMSDDYSSDDMEHSNGACVVHFPSALANTEYVSNPALFPPGKNSIFAVDRGFHDLSQEWRCYYYHEIRYLHQLQMMEEASVVLYLLYLFAVYKRLNVCRL